MKLRDSVSEDHKKFFSYLLLTCKNVSLYPEGHMISMNAIRQFHETLLSHIRQYGDIRIEVEKDRVVCQGAEVQKGAAEEGTLPFTLFRDGIRWVELTQGITLDETREFLLIIHRYSILAKEPEGDLVTAFWEAHFDHVLYEADDFFAGQDPDQMDYIEDLDRMTASDEQESQTHGDAAVAASSFETTPNGGLAIDPALFQLTPQEKIELQDMVSREEISSSSEHLNMLLDMLLQFQDEKDFHIVLGVLKEEFDDSYARSDFSNALIILDGIRKVLDSGRLNHAGAVSLIESFYQDLTSDAKCLKPLEDIWSRLNVQQMETVRMIFRHLTPGAVHTLLRFLLLGQPSKLEKIVEDTIAYLASRDINCLEWSVYHADEKIADKLVHILSRIDGNTPLNYLMRLARHSSASVRRSAVKAISQMRGLRLSTLFEFINDPDASVWRFVLAHMAQSRDEAAETLLMKYLQKIRAGDVSDEQILESFKALGKCGSLRSVPFLRKALLHHKWLAGLKKAPHRDGAASALAYLQQPEASQILEAASRSFHPGLRRIARRALEENSLKNQGGH